MSFRRFIEAKATSQPVRTTDLGVIRVARTEDGELALAPTGPAYGLNVDRAAFFRSETSPPQMMTVSEDMQRKFMLNDIADVVEPHPFDEPKGYSPEAVKVEQQEYIRLMALSRNVGQAIGVNKPTAADFNAWKAQQRLVDPDDFKRLSFIASVIKTHLGITDAHEFSRWMTRAASVLAHVKEAARSMELAR